MRKVRKWNQLPKLLVERLLLFSNEKLIMEEDFEFEDNSVPEGPFHIEVDLYETGDYSRLLVVPANENYVVVHNDEHLCTLAQVCEEPDCWEQEDGMLDDEMVEKIGEAIKAYSNS